MFAILKTYYYSDLLMGWLNKISNYLKKDLVIDLGTANTLIYSPEKGILLNEPSLVAIQKDSQDQRHVLAIGQDAKNRLGQTPTDIQAVRPIKQGVIADFEITQKMLKYFISKSIKNSTFLFGLSPKIIICIPYGITQVEKESIKKAARLAGARFVHLIEAPIAAALGAGLSITEAKGNLVVDIGGGITEVALISLGEIVICQSIKVGGDHLDEAIINYARQNFNFLIENQDAENIKMNLGTALNNEDKSFVVKGRDLVSGAPKTISLNHPQIHQALTRPLNKIVEAVQSTLEKAPPELASDIVDNGIILTGGGATLYNLDLLLKEKTGLPVSIAEEHAYCVVLGAGKILSQPETLEKMFLK